MSFGKTKEEEASEMSSSRVSPSGSKLEAFLGEGSKVVGKLNFTGPVEVNGYVEGEICAKEMLTVGESAVVNAKIHGVEVVVRGKVTGDIVATKKLSLKKPAKITGNITSSCLSIEDGVIFEGSCSMDSSTASKSALKPAGKPEVAA
jgi:cytoskeletal protein CcmA (bactofilin family)